MSKDKPRRQLQDKERFMEGNRQRWAAIYTGLGILVMIAHAYGFVKSPDAFLSYFTGIGVTFILGASATDVMKQWKFENKTENVNEDSHEELTENRNENINIVKTEYRNYPKEDDYQLDFDDNGNF